MQGATRNANVTVESLETLTENASWMTRPNAALRAYRTTTAASTKTVTQNAFVCRDSKTALPMESVWRLKEPSLGTPAPSRELSAAYHIPSVPLTLPAIPASELQILSDKLTNAGSKLTHRAIPTQNA